MTRPIKAIQAVAALAPEAFVVERLCALATAPYRRGAAVLPIPLAAAADPAEAQVPAYDFREYLARHGALPKAPRYVLAPLRDIGADALEVRVDYVEDFEVSPSPVHSIRIELPAQTPAGLSFALPLPETAGPNLRLLRLRPEPPGLGDPASAFRLLALLGDVAKLLWILGREKDELAALAAEVAAQRSLPRARRAGLDLLGEDLRVPRFPPRAASYDPATAALYHLEETELTPRGMLLDETARFGAAGHPARNHGATGGAAGRFGHGVKLSAAGEEGYFHIPHHADFDIPAERGFTAELFLELDPVAQGAISGETGERVVLLKGSLDTDGALDSPGWSLTLGEHRGIANNPRFTLNDGTRQVEVFADLDLGDGTFHHLAAVLDRGARRARLDVDGRRTASVPATLDAVSNTEDVWVGRAPGAGGGESAHGLAATVDELRFSRLARSDFHPLLGEGDDAYRRRLAIFKSWILPTPGALEAALNAEGPIDEVDDPFEVIERDRPIHGAVRRLRIAPREIAVGQRLAWNGDPRATAEAVCGRPEDEPDMRPELLIVHQYTNVRHPDADADARRMQAITARRLDALADLVARRADRFAHLTVERAYDPEASDLHRVGRALVLRHNRLTPGALAAAAHVAGFDFTANRGENVFVAVAAEIGARLEITPVRPPARRDSEVDVYVGRGLDLELRQTDLPASTAFEWTLIPCADGRGRLVAHSADPAELRTAPHRRRRVRLVAEAAGDLWLRVEARFDGVTATGGLRLRIAARVAERPTSVPETAEIRRADGTALPETLLLGETEELELHLVEPAGPGEHHWSLTSLGHGGARLRGERRANPRLVPEAPGEIELAALFVEEAPDTTDPYSFEVRLRPESADAGAILPKDRYDLVMNLLSHFHPIGVEVVTRQLREHVAELADDPAGIYPGYTYPDFQV